MAMAMARRIALGGMELAHVWEVPPAPAYDQPPLTDELLDAAEHQLGVRLPEALVALLRVQNGGLLQLGFPRERNYNTVHYIIRGLGPNRRQVVSAEFPATALAPASFDSPPVPLQLQAREMAAACATD